MARKVLEKFKCDRCGKELEYNYNFYKSNTPKGWEYLDVPRRYPLISGVSKEFRFRHIMLCPTCLGEFERLVKDFLIDEEETD